MNIDDQKEAGKGKKKMNIKWDDDADIFHKIEEMKPIEPFHIEEFNRLYDEEISAKAAKEKDAAEKLLKK